MISNLHCHGTVMALCTGRFRLCPFTRIGSQTSLNAGTKRSEWNSHQTLFMQVQRPSSCLGTRAVRLIHHSNRRSNMIDIFHFQSPSNDISALPRRFCQRDAFWRSFPKNAVTALQFKAKTLHTENTPKRTAIFVRSNRFGTKLLNENVKEAPRTLEARRHTDKRYSLLTKFKRKMVYGEHVKHSKID